MKYRYILKLIFFLTILSTQAQTEYHVFPINHKKTPGKTSGNGSLSKPWDLQTALSNTKVVSAGDVIWIQYHKRGSRGRPFDIPEYGEGQ